MEAGAKTTGSGFYFLKNDAVLLELALQRYAIDLLIAEGTTYDDQIHSADSDLTAMELFGLLRIASTGESSISTTCVVATAR